MRYKILIAAAAICWLPLFSLKAQVPKDDFEAWKRQQKQRFEDYKQDNKNSYEAFRKRANEEYAEMLRSRWAEMQALTGIAPPKMPKPPRPQVAPIDKIPVDVPLPQPDLKPQIVPPVPAPLPDIPLPHTMGQGILQTDIFYGIETTLTFQANLCGMTLHSTSKEEISKAWGSLNNEATDELVHQCVAFAKEHRLSDWGFLSFVRMVAISIAGNGTPRRQASQIHIEKSASEGESHIVATLRRTTQKPLPLLDEVEQYENDMAVLLEAYILSQSGYKMRLAIGSNDKRLRMLVPYQETIYNNSYFIIDGERYYLLGSDAGQYSVVDGELPGSRTSTLLGQIPEAAGGTRVQWTALAYNDGRYSCPSLPRQMMLELGMLDYACDQPRTSRWDYYAHQGLSHALTEQLIEPLRRSISGMSKAQAADYLIDFVQHAFRYATDDEQLGYERPLFADETFFYPYSDCEDRAILYAILVHDLLGLDVVLLHFPGHLATAVRFPTSVEGEYLTVEGERYTVCDPTYIGAKIGMCMPKFRGKDVKIEVVRVW